MKLLALLCIFGICFVVYALLEDPHHPEATPEGRAIAAAKREADAKREAERVRQIPPPPARHLEYRGVALGMSTDAATAALVALGGNGPRTYASDGRVFAIEQQVPWFSDLNAYVTAFTKKYGQPKQDERTYLIKSGDGLVEVHGLVNTWRLGTETLELMERCDGGHLQARSSYVSCVALYAPEYAPKSVPPI